jgi:hypothetical protein
MSSLVTQNEQNILTGLFGNNFDTFSRPITVWKTPIKMPIATPQQLQGSFGFGSAPIEQEYSFIPVSGVFPAVIRYWSRRKIGEVESLQDTNTFNPVGSVRIQVRQDCYDFIENGATDKFSFDDKDFYFEGKAEPRPFLSSLYYEYQLMPKI